MSRGGFPPYPEREYASDRYRSDYGPDSRNRSSGARGESGDPRMTRYDRDRDRDREREWTRYEWERYNRERYDQDRTYERQTRRYDDYGGSNRRDTYADGRSEAYGWDEPEQSDARRWPEAREYRDPRDPRDTNRWSESRYQGGSSYENDYRDRGSVYDKEYRDRPAIDRRAPDDSHVERDRALQRSQRSSMTGRRSQPPHRSHSPRSASHRSSPSSSRRQTSPSASATGAAHPPSSSITAPTGPRDSTYTSNSTSRHHRESWAASAGDREREREYETPTQQPPTGPRRSFARPPPSGPSTGGSGAHRTFSGSYTSYDDRSNPYRAPSRLPFDDQAQSYQANSRAYERSPYSNVPGIQEPDVNNVGDLRREGMNISSITGSRREGVHPKDGVSHLQIPARSPANAPSSSYGGGSGPTTPAVAGTPDGIRSRKASESHGSGGGVTDRMETQIYSISLERIRHIRSFHDNPAMQSLRKALHELADSDVELAGARIKSNVTEVALEKAREEAEAWSIESGRLDLEQRKSGSQGYWNIV